MHLTRSQYENNLAALDHAERIGLRPNVTLDISFSVGDLFDPDQRAGPSLRAFLKLARQWIEKLGGRTAYIYVLENRYRGIGETGVHAHLLMHVPDGLRERFHSLKRIWASNPQVGMTWKPGLFGPIGKRRKPVSTLSGAQWKLSYMSKDLDPAVLAENIPLPEGDGRVLTDLGKPSNAPIYGQKTGVSRNIDAKARASYQRPTIELA